MKLSLALNLQYLLTLLCPLIVLMLKILYNFVIKFTPRLLLPKRLLLGVWLSWRTRSAALLTWRLAWRCGWPLPTSQSVKVLGSWRRSGLAPSPSPGRSPGRRGSSTCRLDGSCTLSSTALNSSQWLGRLGRRHLCNCRMRRRLSSRSQKCCRKGLSEGRSSTSLGGRGMEVMMILGNPFPT